MRDRYRNVVIFSGGIDSTVVAATLKGEASETLLVHTNQGLAQHELQCVELANWLGMDMEVLDFSVVIDKLRIPGMGYIPGYRVFNMLGALTMADKVDAPFIYSGEVLSPFYANDQANDPDYVAFKQWMGIDAYGGESLKANRDEFAAWYGKSMFNKPSAFQFVDPIWGMTKAGIIKLGLSLNVPLEMTCTCRKFHSVTAKHDNNPEVTLKNIHCGSCMPCVSRRAGFKLAEVTDPTVYLESPTIPEQYFLKGK